MRLRGAIAGVTAMLLSGCTSARVAFIPENPIDRSNVNKLRLVSCSKYEQESLLDRLSEGVHAIGPVAVDGRANLLYVHRKVHVGLAWNSPVTVDTYDLKSGGKIRETRIPYRPDLTGADTHSQSGAWLDTKYRAAYVERTGGMGLHQVMRLNLEEDTPAMVARDLLTRLPPQPEADAEHVLLVVGELFKDEGVVFVNRATGAVTSSHTLANPEENIHRRLDVVGALGTSVLAVQDHGKGGFEIQVLQPDGPGLNVTARRRLDYPWKAWVAMIDYRNHELLAVVEHAPDSMHVTQPRLRGYAVPSLTVTREIPLEDSPDSIGRIDRLLFTVNDRTPQVLNIIDLDTGKVLGRDKLNNCLNDDRMGTWNVFTDPDGLYVGVHGTHWIQLFAVKPD